MSSLRNRLGRLSSPGVSAGVPSGGEVRPRAEDASPTPPTTPAPTVRAELDRMSRRERRRGARRARAPRIEELPGETWWTEAGELQIIEHRCSVEARHGRVPVSPARTVVGDVVATIALDPVFRAVDFADALFIDTETTGLAGGAGTVPFLIGMAHFDGDELRVEKLLLRQLGEEGPMLARLAERIETASCVISYNGKSFDWPLLRTRFVMNRVPAPALPPHLDLLHCARRVYKERLERVRLQDLEREILGFQRVGDVPGAEIPGLYLDYLRGGDPAPLARVVDHNRHDLLALAAILVELERAFTGVSAEDDPRDHLACARVAERAGDARLAADFATRALTVGGTGGVDAALLGARLSRRQGELEQELEWLARGLTADPEDSRIHLELAKCLEHRARDLTRALAHARRTFPAEDPDAMARRVARIEAKLLRLR